MRLEWMRSSVTGGLPDVPPDRSGKFSGTHESSTRADEVEALHRSGQTLYQDSFFLCTVKNVGDDPGIGCVYVETVVDRHTGAFFAKVYPTKNAANGVDILASRVIPFFKERGLAIKEIHTRHSSEYCGLVPAHPFETFLAVSHIRHVGMERPGRPGNYLCQEVFGFLRKEFFPAAFRKTYQLPLGELQNELDTFVTAFNSTRKLPAPRN
jgi:hypothetical protein